MHIYEAMEMQWKKQDSQKKYRRKKQKIKKVKLIKNRKES